MGLFDKRDKRKRVSKNEFDSPVEQIDLSTASGPIALPEPEITPARSAKPALPGEANEPAAQAAPMQATAAQAAPEQATAALAAPTQAAAAQAAPRHAVAAQAAPTQATAAQAAPTQAAPTLAYGIENAIELMRTLPNDNIELVVKVVKHTLESLQISTADIIQDAVAKQESIETRLRHLRTDIAEYEKKIADRQKEIEKLNGEYKETNTVRKHLELAENLCKNGNGKRTSISGLRAPSPPADRPVGAAGSRSSPRGLDKPATRTSNSPLLAQGPVKK